MPYRVEMGVYLSTPKTEKASEDGENDKLRYGLSSMQGWRSTMEDAHAAHLDLDTSTSSFSVYDGHGGFGSALNMETLVTAAERRNTPLETRNAIFGTYLASQRFSSSAAYRYA
ncbi:probable protein phosphatase 2C 21 [Camellia sinensis]|uniref:probable protein phosphatase 2C 21 n=1 Tax=Camellia sinensis TaxID=4442 RepID=UPI0010367E66|nr:probable protein phosphatase 2C 21 [Camellia sinensis]